MKKLVLLSILIISVNAFAQTIEKFDIQGHRGARGLMPENTIPAFLKALDLGVDTLELDTVVSKNGKLVVSHEPFFSSEISLDPQGKTIPPEKQNDYNIFKMDYALIKLFDVGSLGNRRFPEQQKVKTYKPLAFGSFQGNAKIYQSKKTRKRDV